MSIYDTETSKIYSDLNLTAPQEPQTLLLKKLTETEAKTKSNHLIPSPSPAKYFRYPFLFVFWHTSIPAS